MSNFNYDAIEVRHKDGKLLCYLDGNYFSKKDLNYLLKVILGGSNNFVISGVHTLKTHVSFVNEVKIYDP